MLREPSQTRIGNSLYFILGIAIALRLPMMNRGIWFDEIRLVTEFTRLPFLQLIGTYGSDNNHPLYTFCAWFSTTIFGESLWALRLPALVFGILSLGALAQLAALVAGRKKAVLITFLAAISYHHIWFSNNARGYTALLFFTLTATHELICLLDDRGRERLLTYSLSLALATWVHTTAVFIGIAHLLVVVFMSGRARPRGLLGLILATIFSLVLHAPILGDMVAFLGGNQGFQKVTSSWTNPLWTIRESLRTFGIAPWLAITVTSLGAIFAAIGVRVLHAIDRRLPYLFFLPGVIGTIVMLAMERNIWPRFYFNLFGFMLITNILCLDACLQWIQRRLFPSPWIPRVAYGLVIMAFLSILPPALVVPKQDYPAAARLLDKKSAKGAKIITLGLATKPYQAYYQKTWEGVDTPQRLLEIMAEKRELYAVDTLTTFLHSRNPKVAAIIDERFKVIAIFPGTVGGGAITVYRFANK